MLLELFKLTLNYVSTVDNYCSNTTHFMGVAEHVMHFTQYYWF